MILPKFLLISAVILVALSAGCGMPASGTKTSANDRKPANTTATPTPVSADDLATKGKIEDALKKAGFSGIEVDASTTPMAVRGTVPADKLAEVIFVAEQAAGKPLKNEIVVKK